jgi:hypothetical protein
MVVWLGLWMINDYIALLLTTIFVPILIAIVIISFIADLLEKSRVGKKYYLLMIIAIIIPSVILILYNYYIGIKVELF